MQQLGVDVFVNRYFDLMNLHTIWTRIANNKAGSRDLKRGFIDVITPHLPLFNHSCELNVKWKRDDGTITVRFFTTRRTARNEELFSNYLDICVIAVERRREMLWPWLWFEGPYLCAKCKRETKIVHWK
ncbi:hypothetical protein EJ02DRAFT_418335 [Clathrospora elynae]|uniref:SET domain-containing protein n=1 Tax=Clathrospora elynae TaxID=706981 RepID=A0A6A5T4F1_9PLEO|nr:hypothetical protein EJ02DRAFT_418335 [Clathrospora elynae]